MRKYLLSFSFIAFSIYPVLAQEVSNERVREIIAEVEDYLESSKERYPELEALVDERYKDMDEDYENLNSRKVHKIVVKACESFKSPSIQALCISRGNVERAQKTGIASMLLNICRAPTIDLDFTKSVDLNEISNCLSTGLKKAEKFKTGGQPALSKYKIRCQ